MDCESCGDLAEEVTLLDALPTTDTVRVESVDTFKDKHRGTETRRVICKMWCGSNHPAAGSQV
jgi:hypothetical protein